MLPVSYTNRQKCLAGLLVTLRGAPADYFCLSVYEPQRCREWM
jgi:hypothetical protein